MRSIRRVLTAMVGVLALTATGALVAVQPASAKDGPISIESAWVGDIHQSHRTVLNSGDTATYHVDVDNTTGTAMQVEVQFEVYSTDRLPTYDYYYTAHKVNMPAGLSRFYSPSTIPVDAYTGDYTVMISIWPTDSASPSNDGDVGEAHFRIFSLSVNPVNDAIKTLQHLALCLGNVVSYSGLGDGDLFFETVLHGAETMGIFKDEQTGNLYEAQVTVATFGLANCTAVTGLVGLFKLYGKMIKT